MRWVPPLALVTVILVLIATHIVASRSSRQLSRKAPDQFKKVSSIIQMISLKSQAPRERVSRNCDGCTPHSAERFSDDDISATWKPTNFGRTAGIWPCKNKNTSRTFLYKHLRNPTETRTSIQSPFVPPWPSRCDSFHRASPPPSPT